MRAEGKAFCSDNWYLLAGVLLQKRKATTQPDSHTNGVSASSNGVSALASTPDLLTGPSNGHSADGHSPDGHSPDGHSPDGHSADGHSANGYTRGSESQGPLQDGVGDCSGLRHRYSTDAYGVVNAAEDQLDELMQVMTALR